MIKKKEIANRDLVLNKNLSLNLLKKKQQIQMLLKEIKSVVISFILMIIIRIITMINFKEKNLKILKI